MTREQFIRHALREAERKLSVPAGWWGHWREVHSPSGHVVVRFAAGHWVLRVRGALVSKHDSRRFAITKAKREEAAIRAARGAS